MRKLLWLSLVGWCASTAWGEASVKSIVLKRDAGGKPGAEVSYFHPQDRIQHFFAALSGLQGRTKARWVFTGVDTSAGKNLKIQEVETSALVANQITGQLKLPRDWPFGTYSAELFVNGTSAKKQTYVVSPPPDKLKPLSYRLFSDVAGKPGAPVKKFSPKQHKLHFLLTVDGYLMGKCSVKWSYSAVKTTAGNHREITSTTGEFNNRLGNSLTGFVELPRDWPKGTYAAQVSLNGRPLQTIPFTVE